MPILKNKKKQVVADGVFYAELDEFLTRELAQAGYAGVEVQKSPSNLTIVIHSTNSKDVAGEKGRRLNEITSVINKRWNFPKEYVKVLSKMVMQRGLCASAQAESLKFKLLSGLPVRRAAYAIIRNCTMAGAKGCEVIVSGKLRQQRANVMKFKEGYMLKTGHGVDEFVAVGKKHCLMKQGMLGCVVKIMLAAPNQADVRREDFVPKALPDVITVYEPKEYPTVEVEPNKKVETAAPETTETPAEKEL